MEDRYHRWLERKRTERCLKNLKRNGFDAYLAATPQAACRQVLAMISDGETFAIGVSETMRAMGVVDELRIMGKTLYDHWRPELSAEEIQAMRLQQGRCDCFLCSANAISEEGEIVNVDGIGNRVAAMTYGPRKVVLVAGANKIVPDLPADLRRAREGAAHTRGETTGL
ncbi:MAG: lactate utilization protein, partial [Desulfosarcina sp.]|nr:lactate utilization protein [Desulfobacterales bacterium]